MRDLERQRDHSSYRWLVATLAIASCEPGQALTGAAIIGAALCEGRLQHAVDRSLRQAYLPQANVR